MPARPVPIKAVEHPALADVLDLLIDAVCVVDPQGHFLFVSGACERIFGYRPEEMLGRPMIELVYHEDRARTLAVVDELVAGQYQPHFENRYVRKDGRLVHIMWSARWSPDHQVRVAVARDVTARKRAESMRAALYAISEATHDTEDLASLFPRIHQIISELLVAPSFLVALYDEVSGAVSFPYDVDAGAGFRAAGAADRDALILQIIGRAQVEAHSARWAGAGLREADCIGVPLQSDGRVIGALVLRNRPTDPTYSGEDVELLQFVSTQVAAAIQRKQMAARLQHMALHDGLTRLPNRALFYDRLRTALTRARRDDARLAVLYLDVDTFKEVNDRFGHGVGDDLLRAIAARLLACVRESDTVARVGGDEFMVLLNSVERPEQARMVAEKIRQSMAEPVRVGARSLQVSASIGLAHYPEHGGDEDALVSAADDAMYLAKHAGGDGVYMATLAGA